MSADGQIRIEIDGDARGFEKELDKTKAKTAGLSGDIERVGSSAAGIGKSLTTFITVPLLGAAGAALKMAGDYDQSMRQIQVITGATADQMELLRAKTDEVASSTQFSKGDAAKALIELAKGGLDAHASMDALSSVLDLATIGEMNLADSSNVVVQAMNTFKNTGATAESVVTALAGAANASTADVNDLALTLSQVGPGAAQAGWSIEETTAVLASFADYGIKGSDAGTSLKTMMTRLVPTTKEAADMMSALGLSFVDANGNIDDAATVAEKLKGALGSLTPEQQNVALSTLFGQDAMRAATVMMNIGEQGVRDYTKAATDMSSVQEQAAAKTEGFSGSFKRAFNSIKSLAISFGEMLAPAASSALDTLSQLCSSLNNSSNATKGVVLGVGAIAAGMPVAIYAFGQISSSVTSSIKAFSEFSKAARGIDVAASTSAAAAGRLVNSFGTAFSAKIGAAKTALSQLSLSMIATSIKTTILTAVTTIQTAAMTAFNAVLMANPLVWIVLAVMALVGALYLLYQHCEPVREIIDSIAATVKEKLLAAFERAKAIFTIFANAAKEAFDVVVNALKQLIFGDKADEIQNFSDICTIAWNYIKDTISGAVDVIMGVWDRLKGAYDEYLSPIVEDAKSNLGEAFSSASETIKTKADELKEKFDELKEKFDEFKQKAEEGMQPLSDKIDELKPKWEEFKQNAADAFTPLGEKIDGVKPKFDELKDKMEESGSRMEERFGGLGKQFEELGGRIEGLKKRLSEAFEPLLNRMQPLFDRFDELKERLGLLGESFSPLELIFNFICISLGIVLTIISSALTGAIEFINGFLTALGGIVEFITGAFDVAIGLFTGDFDLVTQGLQSMSEGMSQIWDGIYQMTIGTLQGMVDGALSMIGSLVGQSGLSFDSLKNAVIEKMQYIASYVVTKAIYLVSRFIETVSSLPGRVSSFFSSLASQVSSTLGSLAGRMYSIASDIISGLVNGIKSGASRVVSAISDMASGAINKAKSVLGINSPSRVFRYIGDMSAKGMQVGWESGEDAILSSITNTAKRAVQAAQIDMIAPTFGEGSALSSAAGSAGSINCTNNFYSPVTSYGDVLRAQRDASLLMAVM